MDSSKKGIRKSTVKIRRILQSLIGSSQEFSLNQQFFHLITFWTSILAPILLVETHIFTPNSIVEGGVIFIGLSNFSLYLLSRRKLLSYSKLLGLLTLAGLITFTWIWKESEGITAPVHYYTILFIMGITILSKTRKDLLYVFLFFSWIMVLGFYELQNPYWIHTHPPIRGIIIDHIFACGMSLISVSIVTHLVTTRYISEKQKAEETTTVLLEKNKIIQKKEEELNEKIILLEKANREIHLTMEKVEAATQAKTDFLSVMSHEVRTALNAIIGLSEWLFIDDPKPQQISNLQNLLFSSKHLLTLLNEILDYNKIEENQLKLEMKNFHLYDIIKNNQASFSAIAKDKGLELQLSIDEIQG